MKPDPITIYPVENGYMICPSRTDSRLENIGKTWVARDLDEVCDVVRMVMDSGVREDD